MNFSNGIIRLVLIILLSLVYSGCLGQSEMASADRYFAEANRLYREERFSEARDIILKLLAHYPENPRLHNNLGNLLFKEGMLEEAMTHYRKALEYSPGYVIASANVAMLSLMAGDTDAAFGILSKIEPDYPDHADVQNGLGVCELRRGNLEKA
ncbi:MAG: tetratricopeptide repeat protein, partial [bacterium]|nr:tetratricopeptide repeat protein [bacterium]